MDLAEIRKKAKAQKSAQSAPPADKPAKSKAEGSIQGSPVAEPAPPVAKPSAAPAAKPAPPPVVETELEAELETGLVLEELPEELESDPLDALFALRPEYNLATEENYLQGLTEQQEELQDEQSKWLTFSLAEEEYALEIGNILEISKPREVTDIPNAPDFILGIISLRGKIIPVFDLKRRLQLGRTEQTAASRIIVCQHQDKVAGLLVDCITQVVRLGESNIEPPPVVLSGLDREMVEGVGRHQGRMMILLHLPSVLNAELT